ncbi:MAG: cytochrome c oxidase subunit II [Flavisolibacter sp.]
MNLLWREALVQVSPSISLQTIFESSSEQAREINRVTWSFLLVAGGIFLLVLLLTLYVVFRFRAGRREGASTVQPSKKWEWPMIGVPLLLVVIFLVFTINTMQAVQPDHEGRKPDVVITGHQWWWEAYYPASSVTTANEIYLPVGKKILLELTSADVIHDWWVPAFGNKMDVLPFQKTYLWVNINKPGAYEGICSEFCGAQHAHMRIKVVAEPPEVYASWLDRQAAPASDSLSNGTGQDFFMQNTCSNCHRISSTTAQGRTGPDLTHIASRKTLLAGMLENSPEALHKFIKNPQQVKPGAHMPDFLMHDSTVAAIVKYLYSLK